MGPSVLLVRSLVAVGVLVAACSACTGGPTSAASTHPRSEATTATGVQEQPNPATSARALGPSRSAPVTAGLVTGTSARPTPQARGLTPRPVPSRTPAGSAVTAGTATVQQTALADASVRWQPSVGASWQWQLTTPVDTSVSASIYDIDMVDNSASVVSKLHRLHRKVICYIDVGSWESYRPDAAKFPASVKGRSDGWPGERWLDIRQLDVLRPLMTARLRQCAQKGFDGVEPDLLDGYENDTGFPITATEQLRYNRMIAQIAHSLGLAVGLKGDPDQARALLPYFDYAINEQCVQYHECDLLKPFIAAHKPVFEVEYSLPTAKFCPVTNALHFSAMRKHLDLDAWREVC